MKKNTGKKKPAPIRMRIRTARIKFSRFKTRVETDLVRALSERAALSNIMGPEETASYAELSAENAEAVMVRAENELGKRELDYLEDRYKILSTMCIEAKREYEAKKADAISVPTVRDVYETESVGVMEIRG